MWASRPPATWSSAFILHRKHRGADHICSSVDSAVHEARVLTDGHRSAAQRLRRIEHAKNEAWARGERVTYLTGLGCHQLSLCELQPDCTGECPQARRCEAMDRQTTQDFLRERNRYPAFEDVAHHLYPGRTDFESRFLYALPGGGALNNVLGVQHENAGPMDDGDGAWVNVARVPCATGPAPIAGGGNNVNAAVQAK